MGEETPRFTPFTVVVEEELLTLCVTVEATVCTEESLSHCGVVGVTVGARGVSLLLCVAVVAVKEGAVGCCFCGRGFPGEVTEGWKRG